MIETEVLSRGRFGLAIQIMWRARGKIDVGTSLPYCLVAYRIIMG